MLVSDQVLLVLAAFLTRGVDFSLLRGMSCAWLDIYCLPGLYLLQASHTGSWAVMTKKRSADTPSVLWGALRTTDFKD